MSQSNKELEMYEELVAKYSKAYYRKVHDLFELEELAQEVWLVILEREAEESYRGDKGATKRTFLVTCIKNHMIDLLVKEIRDLKALHTASKEDSNGEAFDRYPSPEEDAVAVELFGNISATLKAIKYGEFVFEHMGTKSVREISVLSKQEGIPLSKSTVHRTIKKIQKEVRNRLI